LKKGNIDNTQVVNKEIIEMATSLQSPELSDLDLPQNVFLLFLNDLRAQQTEIGDLVPKGSFQILGYTGVTVLVIPQHDIVAVRMFNSFGSPDGYNYLNDVRSFGDTIMQCL
jgi:CubicO group peptidase (beta-lactamase class C family)